MNNPKHTNEESWESEFDQKWKRMRDNGFGGHSSIDDRMIWCVDSEDEDGWVFADESIKSFIRSLLNKQKEEFRKGMVETIDNFAIMKGSVIDLLDETDDSRVMTNRLNENLEFGYRQACHDIKDLIIKSARERLG